MFKAIDFCGGIDIGKVNDHPAIVIIARGEIGAKTVYRLAAVQELPLGKDYQEIVNFAADLTVDPECCLTGRIWWSMDFTGQGQAVFERVLENAILSDITFAITFTPGSIQKQKGIYLNVPKKDLIANALATLQSGDMLFDSLIPSAGLLKKQMLEYEFKRTTSGNLSYEGKSNAHDDVCAAFLCACWLATFLPLGSYDGGPNGGFAPYVALNPNIYRSPIRVESHGSQYPRPPRGK